MSDVNNTTLPSINNVLSHISKTINGSQEVQHDAVENPEHYQNGSFETIDEMIIVFGPVKTYDFCILNAWKYRARAPYKGRQEEDLMKSDQYLKMAKEIRDRNVDFFHMDIKLIRSDGDED